jgi:hypothetical protein
MSPEAFRPSSVNQPGVNPDAFIAEMCGVVRRGFRGSGYAGAVRGVHERLPNMPPSHVLPYTDWLIERINRTGDGTRSLQL